MRILVTGVAGFIGMHVTLRLMSDGHEVAGLDNLNDYYDVSLKQARLDRIGAAGRYQFYKIDLSDLDGMNRLFSEVQPEIVINLAAQAGVRYSLENPHAYLNSNIIGFGNILELSKLHNVKHIVYASSSSVYGGNARLPFSETDNVDHPLSIYAATKKSNELMAHAYSHLYDLPTTGLRFFTVYGPWGRPDMALFKFTKAILENKTIEVFNSGNHKRDFTYIDDIVNGVVRILEKPPQRKSLNSAKFYDASKSAAPWRVYNIGNHRSVSLFDFIAEIENALEIKASIELKPMQPGDVAETYASVDAISKKVGFSPNTKLSMGISQFVEWYKSFYGH